MAISLSLPCHVIVTACNLLFSSPPSLPPSLPPPPPPSLPLSLLLLPSSSPQPLVNQIEVNPFLFRKRTIAYFQEQNIQIEVATCDQCCWSCMLWGSTHGLWENATAFSLPLSPSLCLVCFLTPLLLLPHFLLVCTTGLPRPAQWKGNGQRQDCSHCRKAQVHTCPGQGFCLARAR